MSWIPVLQTIGLIFIVEGNIIVIYELWKKKLNYLCDSTLKKEQSAMQDSARTLIKHIKKSKGEVVSMSKEKFEEMTDKLFFFFCCQCKRKFFEAFKTHMIHIGIMYIVLGAIIQLICFWI